MPRPSEFLFNLESAESEEVAHDLTTSSLSRCSSSSSIVTNAEKNLEEASVSLETPAWTDSKHSSYLDYMESNFVQSLYSREYCDKDVCGKAPHHHHHHIDTGDFDDDSAESRLCIPDTTSVFLGDPLPQFKMYHHGDGMWRAVNRQMVGPPCIPWVLLTNPWVKHFQTTSSSQNNSDTMSSMMPSAKDEVEGCRQVQNVAVSMTTMTGEMMESRQGVDAHQFACCSNPCIGSEKRKTKLIAFGTRNGDLEVGKTRGGIEQSLFNKTVDARTSNAKKRALPLTYEQVCIARQKIGSEGSEYLKGPGMLNQACKSYKELNMSCKLSN